MPVKIMLTYAHWIVVISFCLIQTSHVFAQDEFNDDHVRQQTERILDDAEFRYFDHLDDAAERPPYRSATKRMQMSSGEGGKGSRAEGGDSKSGPRDAEGKSRSKSEQAENRSAENAEDSSSSWSMGAAGAVGNVFGAIFHALAYLVLVAVCALIVYLIVLAVINRQAEPSNIVSSNLPLDLAEEIDHSPGELPADAYLAKARELAEQRQYREAIAYLLLGGMSAIERSDLIRHRRGLTFRDYLRVLRGREPQYAGFQSLIGLYEPVGFGRRVASFQTFQDALGGYERTVTPLM